MTAMIPILKRMSCSNVRRRAMAYLDGRLRGSDLVRLKAHLQRCPECDAKLEDLGAVGASLRELPKVATPSDLRTRLGVIASHERKLILEADGSRLLLLWNDWKFRLKALMRPLTIPATGGFCSALFLFGTLAFSIASSERGVAYEVPVMISSNPIEANLVPVELRSFIVLKMSVDGNGHILEYAFRDGRAAVRGDAGNLQHQNIDVPEIPGALSAGEAISSDIQISLRPLDFRP